MAAGNNATGACEVWPAAFGKDLTGAITVGAIDRLGARAIFNTTQSSNYGQCVEVWAPGLAIFSTILGGSTTGNVGGGTSFAAPFVAGIATLISDLYKNLLPREMEALLKSNTMAAGYYTNPTDGIYLQFNVPQANKY